MEQFLRDFFNDNSVCVGLCDLKRKIAVSGLPKPQPQQTFVNSPQSKPQKQTLAQKFAAQQQAYAAQQAYLAQQRQKYAQEQPKVVQQKPVYSEAKPVFVNKNPYYQQNIQQTPQVKVIVNGNMKKVVSAAVPAARYNNM